MTDELIKRIRRTQADCADSLAAADLIEQQAARIAALESAAKAEPIYQTCFMNGQWRDVDRFEYDRAKGLRDDLARIVYTSPAATDNGGGRDAWISIDERLPENDQIVAFVVKANQESPNWYLNGHVLGGTYHENWGFSTPGVGHRASHWMPLPAAPAALSKKAGE